VISDNVAGAKLAVNHLHEIGRRKIAAITGMTYTRPGRDRLTGYRDQIEELGLSQNSDYIQGGDFYEPSGFTAMEALLALDDRPDAVFCASDMMAVGAIGAAKAAGVKVPRTSPSSALTMRPSRPPSTRRSPPSVRTRSGSGAPPASR